MYVGCVTVQEYKNKTITAFAYVALALDQFQFHPWDNYPNIISL